MTRSMNTMVSLGSSYAAGPGIKPVENQLAQRSKRNYAHLVAHALGAHLTDATISGATTATILTQRQRVLWHRFAPQIAAVTPDTDLVTITAGGNDLEYIGEAGRVAITNRLIANPISRRTGQRLRNKRLLIPRTDTQISDASSGLEQIVLETRRQAPGARIVLVDYLPLFDDDSTPGLGIPFQRSEIRHFKLVAAGLSQAFATAAAHTGTDLIPASDYEPGHGVGSPEPYLNGLQRSRGNGAIFHPTALGMQTVATKVVELVTQPDVGSEHSTLT